MQYRTLESLALALCALILAVLFYQALFWQRFTVPPIPIPKAPVKEIPCIGAPIFVNQPYLGSPIDPHSCLPQCEDDQPHYLVYTNNKATQCEEPPGCNDYGEDHGSTCRAPQMTNAPTVK